MMFLVVEGQDSTCLSQDLPLLFISKVNAMSSLHTQNFTIKRTLRKTFAKLSNEKTQS